MSTTYRAAVVVKPGQDDAIQILELPASALGADQVRVAIAAATVNPVDLAVASGVMHQAGLIDQPEHTGLGWDFSGTVLEAGAGVDLAPGTRVAGLVAGLDRDFGTYADQVVLPTAAVAVVPDGLDLVEAATVPLNALTGAQLVDLLGDGEGRSLLVTGAAGTVAAYAIPIALERGWSVTGLARTGDEEFVRGLGAAFTTEQVGSYDAVADTAVLGQAALALVRDGGVYVGVQPAFPVPAERGVQVTAVGVVPDGERLAELLDRAARGELAVRVAGVLPLERWAEAHAALGRGGVRGKYVLEP